MEVRLVGESEVYLALAKAGFKQISRTDNGYMVYCYTVAQVQAVANVAFELGMIRN